MGQRRVVQSLRPYNMAHMDGNGPLAARNHDEVEVLALIDVRAFSFFFTCGISVISCGLIR